MGLHRLVLGVKIGRALRPGEWARHKCHFANCIKPDHLHLGDAETYFGQKETLLLCVDRLTAP